MRRAGYSLVGIGGYSLVELMIALALGSLVTLGIVQLFIANSETYNLLSGQSRMQESARFAMDLLAREARRAGYKGCNSVNQDFYSTIRPASSIPYEFDMRFGIQGFESASANRWAPSLDLLPNTDAPTSVFTTSYGYNDKGGIDVSKVMSGTDVVTFRYLSQTEARLSGYSTGAGVVAGAMPQSTEQPVIRINKGWDEFDLDHLVMIHDCEKSTLFRVTSANPWGRRSSDRPKPVGMNRQLSIGHDLEDTDSTRNQMLKLASTGTFGPNTAVSAIQSSTFFIAPGRGKNNAGRKPASLWIKSSLRRPRELVEGVEDLQMLYGVDTDDDRIPNQYVPASTITDWNLVMTVSIRIVVTSVDTVGATSAPTHGCTVQACVPGQTWDGLMRRSYSQTVQLRNHG